MYTMTEERGEEKGIGEEGREGGKEGKKKRSKERREGRKRRRGDIQATAPEYSVTAAEITSQSWLGIRVRF
jgi:hypothetical protein